MAIFKKDNYSDLRIVTGDDDFDSQFTEQLKISMSELVSAINAVNVTDTIWKQILLERSRSHETLIAKVPGVKI